MFEAGTASSIITADYKGVGMLGYGLTNQNIEGKATDLYARAYVLYHPSTGRKIAFVNAELCFITISVKRGVVKTLKRQYPELGFDFDNVMITAQHTHSGPGGFDHFGLYNLPVTGFVKEVYKDILDGIIRAIVQADQQRTAAHLYWDYGYIKPNRKVAFNRSMTAYNRNPEVDNLSQNKSHLAVDRTMRLLRIDADNGNKIGSINWFAVHTTSISNDNTLVCSDNKGYASKYLEETISQEEQGQHHLAAFAQESAGDVSPNWIWDNKKKWTRGKYHDDFESAKFNGRIQFEKALELYQKASEQDELQGEIDYAMIYVDFSEVWPDGEFTDNDMDASTTPSSIGLSFFKGTSEGPGVPILPTKFVAVAIDLVKGFEYLKSLFVSRRERKKIYRKYRMQYPKKIVVESGERRVMGASRARYVKAPDFIDDSLKAFKDLDAKDKLGTKPWQPQILPLQIIIIGKLAIAGFPSEITTVAGKRLRQTIYDVLKHRGVEQVVISSYANAYSGYVTTYEEYHQQAYEGGHTVFGKWTLAAYRTKFKELAEELLKDPKNRNTDISTQPTEFSEDELNVRSFIYTE